MNESNQSINQSSSSTWLVHSTWKKAKSAPESVTVFFWDFNHNQISHRGHQTLSLAFSRPLHIPVLRIDLDTDAVSTIPYLQSYSNRECVLGNLL